MDGVMRVHLQQMARSMNLERTPCDEEYQAIREDRSSDLRKFFMMFKPKEVRRARAGTMPATFQVFNVDRMLREDSTLRYQVGFSLSIGMPTKAMMIPSVWIVTQNDVWIETTYLDLDDTAILVSTKDVELERLLEYWFQSSRRSTSSQIKNVAMIVGHPHHISADKFLEDRENLLVTRGDRPMRTVRFSLAGLTAVMTVPSEQTSEVDQTQDLRTEMDESIEGVKADIKNNSK